MNKESIAIALNILQFNNEQQISHYYKSQYNKTRENKVILLMITDNEKQHYLAVKELNALLKKKTEHSGDYCLDCLKLFRNNKIFKNYKNHTALNKLVDTIFSLFSTQNQH